MTNMEQDKRPGKRVIDITGCQFILFLLFYLEKHIFLR